MPLGQHLLELRKRLLIAGLAVILGAVGGYFTSEWVWAQLQQPLLQVAEEQGRTAEVAYTYITEAFDTLLQISFTVGFVISSPVWLYQLWAFFVPALHRKEKRYALGFVLAAFPLFLAGCFVGWLILPNMVELMIRFAASDTATLLQAKVYLDFALKLLLAVGLAFILPVFLVLLNFVGVLSAKQILKGWRIAILLISVFAALATPAADVVSMMLLIGSMGVLYFAAAGVAWLHDRAVRRRDKALDEEYGTASA
ncbi:sec-independent protein translocase protein TatC [Homoserinimonas aerilata]|uniref:Sec-independent protein translocase protein TatC n=2 Tax=Homoserinimonas aerilata TaxID=1162970 RepID=A0A542YJ48_9MICO|nr:twin-arginine translocase subunit TatC [Homoserinimonas aerilata]TQL48107.1 sec-independent protein translocase protein TatC [Homoserinimonas aerilata]